MCKKARDFIYDQREMNGSTASQIRDLLSTQAPFGQRDANGNAVPISLRWPLPTAGQVSWCFFNVAFLCFASYFLLSCFRLAMPLGICSVMKAISPL